MKLLDLGVEPYTSELTFKNDQEKEYWSNKIEMCSRTINKVEISLVERGIREASTLHVGRKEMTAKINEISERGLIFTPIYWIKSYCGFSHRHTITTKDDPESICYGIVTRSKKSAQQFKGATLLKSVDHETIGQLLGYPDCCRKFFNSVWVVGYVDPIWQQAVNAGGKPTQEKHGGYLIEVEGYPECVAMQRYWGVRISFHLPCSFKCEQTKKFAHVWLNEATRLNPAIPKALLEILSLPTVWDAHRGVATINTPHYKGTSSSVVCADVHSVYYLPC